MTLAPPRPFVDLGPLLDYRGLPIYGSDPWFGRDKRGRWWLYHTYGRTLRKVVAGDRGAPGIYRRQSMGDWRGPFGPAELVVAPDGVTCCGVETFSMAHVPGAGWVGTVTEYEPFRRNSRMVLLTAEDLGLEIVRHPKHVVRPQWDWERSYVADDVIGEAGLAYVGWGLLRIYSALSDMPKVGRAWRTGIESSVDLGKSWSRHPFPILTPPSVFQASSGINTYSHGCLLVAPDGTIELFALETGNVGPKLKGITSWQLSPGPMTRNPNGFLLTPASTGFDHVGAPCVQWVDGLRAALIHATEPKTGRHHLRAAVEQGSALAQAA